jgi:hypothetical protein
MHFAFPSEKRAKSDSNYLLRCGRATEILPRFFGCHLEERDERPAHFVSMARAAEVQLREFAGNALDERPKRRFRTWSRSQRARS